MNGTELPQPSLSRAQDTDGVISRTDEYMLPSGWGSGQESAMGADLLDQAENTRQQSPEVESIMITSLARESGDITQRDRSTRHSSPPLRRSARLQRDQTRLPRPDFKLRARSTKFEVEKPK